MQEVFDKARELSPCVLIMEDMDSLINDRNRSFFLNQMDGLVGNDGLLVIGVSSLSSLACTPCAHELLPM